MNERNQVIDRIKKLLRMKRGGTLAEVETALALAREIARKHGIDITSVNPDDEEQARPVGQEEAIRAARIQFECKYSALICKQFFNVETLLHRPHWNKYAISFIGTDWDRQVAIYVYKFLVGHFRREWTSRRGRCRNRQAFIWGLYIGLCGKLTVEEPEAESEALVLVGRAIQRRRDYMAKYYPETESTEVKPDNVADEAFHRGLVAGRQTNIRPAVESGQPKPKELTL